MIIRIAFAVSVLFGGLGILAYLAVAIFAPADDGAGVPVEGGRGREIARLLGIAVIAVIAVSGLCMLVAGAAFVTGLGYGLPVAVGDRRDRDRPRGALVPRRRPLAAGAGFGAVDRRRGGRCGRPRPRGRRRRPRLPAGQRRGDPGRRLRAARRRPARGRPPRHRLGREAGSRPRPPRGPARPSSRCLPRSASSPMHTLEPATCMWPASGPTGSMSTSSPAKAPGRRRSCGSMPTSISVRSSAEERG